MPRLVALGASGVAGYLLGTLPSARLAARAAGGTHDLGAEGSGNPGALNAAQVLGRSWGLAVLGADMGKGAAAAIVGRRLAGAGGAYLGATAAIAGHVVPFFDPSGGGKGVATSAGATLAVFPVYFPVDLAVALAGAARSRRAEQATQLACTAWVAAALVVWRWRLPNGWGPPPTPGLVGFAGGGAALVLWAFRRGHRPVGAPG